MREIDFTASKKKGRFLMGVLNNYINEVKEILKNARQKVYNSIISAMIEHIGKLAEGL